ncbi:MAG: type II secretion system ATPase GspE [Deltaproteobacteria bacterium]|nr:type II secretion system ATPase GspE [Deltaproteobacteria bacterium]MBZ0219840.1 type II secretion system ATPase GspE [Deltaproteobacteria bacterium]
MSRERIGERLLRLSLITEEMLLAALDERSRTGCMTGEALTRLGFISAGDFALQVAGSLGVQAVLEGDFPEGPVPIGRQPAYIFLKENRVAPVALDGETLLVASARPQDPFPAEALKAFTGMEVEQALGVPGQILDFIERHYGSRGRALDELIGDLDEKETGQARWERDDIEGLKEAALEAPVIELVNLIIARAVERRASDIHIEPFEGGLNVRYRVDGVLHVSENLPGRLHPVVSSRVKIMARLNIAERRLPQDGRVKHTISGKEVDIRVSTVPTLYGESIVMRLLDPSSALALEDLGFSARIKEAFSLLAAQPHGMILVTGPTGSGKSTTLYAALSRMDTGSRKVITIEDPIEYKLEGVNQIQVKPAIGLTFASGLRSIVRQDPDIIMVGEIRDAETAEIAVHSALTGHLILSTMHTNDAAGAVARLLDMGIEGYLISSCLLGVLAQRLVRVICPACKESYAPSEREIKLLMEGTVSPEGIAGLARGRGCEECGGTGYRGRTGIFELMTVTDRIRELTVERQGAAAIKGAAISEGMAQLRSDGWDKVISGITTVEEVERVTLQ